jgi:predicted AlkP superfamily pyrophosphatase or phosphodiesterase
VVAGAARSARHHRGALVYAYYADLDKTGHLRGCGSEAWEYQLAITDRFVEQLASGLPEDGLLIVTGDHGMVDVPAAARLDVEADPRLCAAVRLIGGEPRMRYVYTEPGAEADVLAAWQEIAAAHAWVVSREQAVDEGWFGPRVPADMLPRIGNVIAAARGDATLVLPAAEPRETELAGHHGSLTEDEQLVPLLIAYGGGEAVSGTVALQAEAG